MRNRQFLVFAIPILLSLSASADTKIRTRNTTMGHSMESTVYIKGARERTEMNLGIGPSMVTLIQCDQKRMITINPQANTCMVVPMGDESAAEAPSAPAAGEASRKGGTITFNVNTADTGERQKMMGLNARHIKMTMNAESSADACSKTSMHSESDGWYVDIAPALSCSMGMTAPPPSRGGRAGCQDSVRFKRSGVGHPGYPLKQTTTTQAEGHSFTTVSEVVDLATAPLEASLFDMPAGCRVVTSYQELMNIGAMAAGMMGGTPPATAPPPPSKPEPPAAVPPVAAPAPVMAAKASGVIRVGVVKIKDVSQQNLPLDNLRMNLMSEITLRQMEAVAIDSESESAVAGEATEKQCDYVLYTDANQLKAPDSGGVVLPPVLKGVSLDKSKYQALLAMTLYRVGKPQPELKQLPLAAAGDQMGVNAVMAGFEMEAQKVADQVKKDSEPAKPGKAVPGKTTPPPAKKPATKKPG